MLEDAPPPSPPPAEAAPERSYMSRLSLLVDLASLLSREVDFDALLATAGERLAAALRADRASIWLVDAESGELVTRVAVLPEVESLRLPLGRGIAGFVARTGETVRSDDAQVDPRFEASVDKVTGYITRSTLVAPLRADPGAPVRGVVQVLNRAGGPFDADDQEYLEALGTQLARALELTTLRAADARGPGLVLRGPFNRIVGRSAPLAAVYERIGLAAQTDATVLLRGETGTGKGLFARAIHVNSQRQARPFVTIDCTTLPAQLVESELFGHERGAFTGADRRVPGKVELAHGGTLFLDELGDLPAESQGKLLRFLQERTFERVGGRETLHADVRVAATHADLERAVRRAASARTSTTGCGWWRSSCRRCARAAPTRSTPWPTTSPTSTPTAIGARGRASTPRRSPRCAPTTGRGTCASSSTGSRARWPSRPMAGSPPRCCPDPRARPCPYPSPRQQPCPSVSPWTRRTAATSRPRWPPATATRQRPRAGSAWAATPSPACCVAAEPLERSKSTSVIRGHRSVAEDFPSPPAPLPEGEGSRKTGDRAPLPPGEGLG
ncbi:MAG: sigma 54-interacting transcriptional regulator [Polyangiaceae bacterium]